MKYENNNTNKALLKRPSTFFQRDLQAKMNKIFDLKRFSFYSKKWDENKSYGQKKKKRF